jgi:hypothetical protein
LSFTSPTLTSSAKAASSTFVVTPYGLAPKQCVHGIPSNSTVFNNATVVTPNGAIFYYPPCTTASSSLPSGSPASPFPTNSWVDGACYGYSSPAIGKMDSRWTVPSAPSSSNGQTIYLFDILQPGVCDGSVPLIQPVLQWGNNGYYGGAYWEIVSWYCGGYGGNCGGNYFYSYPITVSVGHQIDGLMTSSSCSKTGSCNWVVSTTDVTGGLSTSINCGGGGGANNLCGLTFVTAGVVLEVWGVTSCSNYPASGTTTFGSFSLKDSNGNTLTPSWQGHVWYNDGCGESVTTSSSSVTIYY